MPLHIEYLLTGHHCVVVAGLGAFLVNDRSATYDEARHEFLPPSRLIGYTPEIAHTDGLLVQSIARRERISIDEASKIVANEVAEFRARISEEGSAAFGSLGEFSLSEGSMLFEPSPVSLPMLRFHGLEKVDIKPLADDSGTDRSVADVRPAGKTSGAWLRAVASVLLILMIGGLVYTTTGLVDTSSVELATLDSMVSECLNPSSPCETELSRGIILNIATPSVEDGQADISEIPPSVEDAPFLLVVASLESARSARKHIGDDTHLRFLNMDGKYRVYVDSFPTMEAALKAVPEYSDRYENIWVCRR